MERMLKLYTVQLPTMDSVKAACRSLSFEKSLFWKITAVSFPGKWTSGEVEDVSSIKENSSVLENVVESQRFIGVLVRL